MRAQRSSTRVSRILEQSLPSTSLCILRRLLCGPAPARPLVAMSPLTRSSQPEHQHHGLGVNHVQKPWGPRLGVAAAAGSTSPSASLSPFNYRITSCMDSGNIEVVDVPEEGTVNLAIRPDPFCATDGRAHFQWFNFRLVGAAGQPLRLRIVNAGAASYAPAWNGYQACASYDLQDWFRVPTTYDAENGVMTISHTPQYDAVQYAYFAPYTLDRHAALLARMQGRSRSDLPVRLHVLGTSLDGRDLEMLQIGPAASLPVDAGAAAPPAPSTASTSGSSAPLRVWVIARQHPGESMAEWFAEGLLERLTDPEDGLARSFLGKACVYVVPNMCPDGSFRGHLRTNAAGTNLNRAWAAPSLESSPEVLHTLAAMERTGVDFFIDVHGDEELPHVFVAGLDGIPAWGPRLRELQAAFCAAYSRHAPEFQTAHGYAVDKPGAANLSLASKQVGQRFDCLSLTLEMPFKDSLEVPDPRVGWSPGRAKRLGAALLGAINEVAHMLR